MEGIDVINQLNNDNDSKKDIYENILKLSTNQSQSVVIVDNIDTILKHYNDNINNDEEIIILKILMNVSKSSIACETICNNDKILSLIESRLKSETLISDIKSQIWSLLIVLAPSINKESNVISLIVHCLKMNIKDLQCLENTWQLSKYDQYSEYMVSKELGLIEQLKNVMKENKDEARLWSLKIIANLAVNKLTQIYLASTALGMIPILKEIIKEDNDENRLKALSIIQVLGKNKKNQQYLSSKELDLIPVLIFVTKSEKDVFISNGLQLLLSLSGNETNNEYLISTEILEAMKIIVIKFNGDTANKAWDVALRLSLDLETRIPWLCSIIKEDKDESDRLKALNEIHALSKEKDYHQALMQPELELMKTLSISIDNNGETRSKALSILKTLSKTSIVKTTIAANVQLKEKLYGLFKETNKNNADCEVALKLLDLTANNDDEKLSVLFLKLIDKDDKDVLKVMYKDLNQLLSSSSSSTKVDTNKIDMLLNRYTSSTSPAETDDETEQLLFSIILNITKDTTILEILFDKIFVYLLSRLTTSSRTVGITVWKIIVNLASNSRNKISMGSSKYDLFSLIMKTLKSNDDSIECLNLTLDLCRHDDNRKSLGLSEHGLVPLLVQKVKASTGEFRTQALGVLRKLSIATENRLYLGTEEFITILCNIVKEEKGDILTSALIILTKLSVRGIIEKIASSEVYTNVFNLLVEAGKSSDQDCISRSLNFFMCFARYPDTSKLVKGIPNSVPTFTSLLESNSITKLKAAFIISYLVGKDEGKGEKRSLLASVPDLSSWLVDVLQNTLDSKGGDGYSLGNFELPSIVNAILALSISDENKAVLVKLPLVPLLVRVLIMFKDNKPEIVHGTGNALGGGNDIDSATAAIGALIQLSFYFDSDEALRAEFITPESKVADVLSDLLKLSISQSERKVLLDPESIQNASSLLRRLTSSSSTDNVKEYKKQHIMLSYAWNANKKCVLELQSALQEKGYDVWRDETGSSTVPSMSGDTDSRMAEAIEASATVIICVSPSYKESANCRMEARYSGARCKKGLVQLVFVMMDSNYTTHTTDSVDGWIAFLIGDALWYPLWSSDQVSSTANQLVNLIGDKGKLITQAIVEPTPLVVETPIVSSSSSSSSSVVVVEAPIVSSSSSSSSSSLAAAEVIVETSIVSSVIETPPLVTNTEAQISSSRPNSASSSSAAAPFPPSSSNSSSFSSPIINNRQTTPLSSSSFNMSISNREEALYNEVQALKAQVQLLENSSHAWRILKDSTKIISDKQKSLYALMEELGLEEACDLRQCSKKHAESIAEMLKPLAGNNNNNTNTTTTNDNNTNINNRSEIY